MQFTLDLLLIVTLSLAAIIGWSINILGMPGNWLLVAMAAGLYWLASPEKAAHIGLMPLSLIVVVTVIGELLEFAASALGANRLGASKRATALAVAGSVAGAIVGLFAGSIIPIPIVGQLIGSLLLGGAGAALGAASGERWAGKSWDDSFQVGHAAFWGRLLGTVGKAVCGTVACIAFLIAIFST